MKCFILKHIYVCFSYKYIFNRIAIHNGNFHDSGGLLPFLPVVFNQILLNTVLFWFLEYKTRYQPCSSPGNIHHYTLCSAQSIAFALQVRNAAGLSGKKQKKTNQNPSGRGVCFGPLRRASQSKAPPPDCKK